MSTEQKLQKEIDRLTRALKVAQDLNAGLEKDKDSAWELVQMMLMQSPEMRVIIEPVTLDDYDPRRFSTEIGHDPFKRCVVLTLREK